MALPIFALTLFVSAFLLFMVQPMIGKMILPKLGGTPQVWNTCCVFFQCSLLAGYGYTHTVTSILKTRYQLFFHGAIMLVPLLVLFGFGAPFIMDWWSAPPGANPIPSTLYVLTVVVAVPFVVVATSAPLLQRWFADTGHPAAKDPYFLYGASNLGSMLALLSYPFMTEPMLTLLDQRWAWAIAYVVLVVMVGVCAFLVLKAPPQVQLAGPGPKHLDEPTPPSEPAKPEPPKAAETSVKASPAPSAARATGIRRGSKQKGRGAPRHLEADGRRCRPSAHAVPAPVRPYEMTWWKRIRWVALAAVPCSMMLGVTTYVSTDISAIALFWVVPLALYLLSFILVFLRWPVPWATREAPPLPLPLQLVGLGLFGIALLSFLVFGTEMILGTLAFCVLALFAFLLLGKFVFPQYQWAGVPHQAMVVLQPFGILVLALILLTHAVSPIYRSLLVCVIGFFLTAMVCHGELARDRPPTKWLTDFYLCMSLGGALGGIFNAILAPLLFINAVEFPLAIIAAGLMRPKWPGEPWTWSIAKALMPPESIKSLNDSGDDLYRRLKGSTDPEDKADPGWLFNLPMDFILAGVVFLLAFILYTNGTSPERWGFTIRTDFQDYSREILDHCRRNPLFAFAYKTLSMQPRSASAFAQAAANVLIFGVPLLCCLIFFSRPLRFGLALAAALFALGMFEDSRRDPQVYDNPLIKESPMGKLLPHADRTYFGILRVHAQIEGKNSWSTYLMHGTTHHGLNYQEPKELRRLATTYYHRYGPVGVIMEKLNWFPYDDFKVESEKQTLQKELESPLLSDARKEELKEQLKELTKRHAYEADSRLTASLVGLGAGNMLGAGLPMEQLACTQSEPAYACVGLGTGTMASYARPFQHMTFYEIDDKIRKFSLSEDPNYTYTQYLRDTYPKDEDFKRATLNPNYLNYRQKRKEAGVDLQPFFNYVIDALERGANIEIIMGDARQSLREENEDLAKMPAKREHYYRVIELDAFSSDAIPVHLITKEAIELYWKKLTPDAVLMVHTSNRHVNLVLPVTKVAKDLDLEYRVGKDQGDRRLGHFASEYVMLAKKKTKDDTWPERLPEDTKNEREAARDTIIWYTPPVRADFRTWTDDYSNMVGVLRWGINPRAE